MLHRLTIALLGTAFCSVSAMAQQAQNAQSPFYIAGAVGQSTYWDVETDGGGDVEFDLLAFFISGALGYRVSPNLRAEAEWLFESADIDDSSEELEVIRGTLAGYYDFAQTEMFGFDATPYAGGGAGIANVDAGGDDENEFAFHLEGGLSMPITNNIDFVPGLRFEYIFLDDDDFDDDLWITQIRAGIRYSF